MYKKILTDPKAKDTFVLFFFLLFIPVAAHILFSFRGFNITDNGYILAYSRRLLNGQIPHRDFIYICPAGSPFLHMPFVFFGGEYTFWISRFFVWFQFSCIALAWLKIIGKYLANPFKCFEKLCLGIISFALSVHNFPIMAWTTIDALFLCSIGIALCIDKAQRLKFLGYLLIGSSFLCRQSFLPLAFFSIIILGDWRQLSSWLALALPGMAYLIYLCINRAIPDAIIQIGQNTDWFFPGVVGYITNSKTILAGILCGLVGLGAISGHLKIPIIAKIDNMQKMAGTVVAYMPVLAMAIALGLGKRIVSCSYVMFGAALAVLLHIIITGKRQVDGIRVGILVLLVAWCVSLSVMYRFPGIASGILALFLVGYTAYLNKNLDNNRKQTAILQIILVLITLLGFIIAQIKYSYLIFGEVPTEPKFHLDRIFPGTKMIKVDQNTYQLLVDLKTAIEKTEGFRYAIITDIASWWVKSDQRNILPVEWVGTYGNYFQKNPALYNRVIKTLEANRGDLVIIIHKVRAYSLSKGFYFYTKQAHNNTVVSYVFNNFKKIDETRFFELYR